MQPITRFFSLIITVPLMVKKIHILLIFLLIPITVFGQLSGDGSLSDPYSGILEQIDTEATYYPDTTWAGTVYINGDVTIDDEELMISSGTNIIFVAENADLIINGTGQLTADGTSGSIITFTADHDNDGNYGEDAINNGAGNWDERWGHIDFNNPTGTSLLDYCIIEYGDVSGYGGGIHVNFSDLTISNSIIRDNKATFGGGIFVNKNDSPEISNCLIKDNASDRSGGGIYFWNGAGSVVENCIFDGNRCNETSTAQYSGGGLSSISATSVKILNSTFVNNTSYQTNGQSIMLYASSSARVINCIVWGSGNEIYLYNTTTNAIVNCAVEGTGASSYVNSIDLNSDSTASDGPNFVATTKADWSIKFISPCRDIGTDTYTGVTIPPTDSAGNKRIGTTDIGAYEVQYSRWKTNPSDNNSWTDVDNWEQGFEPGHSGTTGDIVIPALSDSIYAPIISGSVSIASDKYMILEPGAKATFGTISNSGTLNLESDANNISSLIIGGEGVTANVELYLTGGDAGDKEYRWHYISSPFYTKPSITPFSDVTLNLAQFYEELYSSTTQAWVAYDGFDYATGLGGTTFSVLSPKRGYNFYDNVNNKITISGQLAYADVDTILKFGDNLELWSGFNLLGNPFPSGLDWDEIINDDSYPDKTSKSLYFTRNNVQYSYVGGVGIPEDSVTGIIPPMQGFFVKTYDDGNKLFLLASARTHNSIHARYKGETIIPLVRLSILQTVSSTEMVPPYTTIDSLSDETVVRFDEKAKPGLDNNFDALKMFLSDNKLSIYSYNGETKYAINGIPFPETYTEIPIAVNIIEGGDQITISAIQLQELDNYHVTLKDLVTGYDVDLKTADLIFTATSGTYSDRFVLTITKQTTGLSDIFDPEPKKAFNIYSSRGILFINPAKDVWNGRRGNLKIYDITGKIVKQQKNIEWQKGVTKEISLNVAQGIYLVEICSATDRFVGRVSIVR